jgi:hypothetical protein
MSALLSLLLTVTAFLSYEVEDPGGLLKTCYYESPYGTHALTVRVTQLCPTTLQVDV